VERVDELRDHLDDLSPAQVEVLGSLVRQPQVIDELKAWADWLQARPPGSLRAHVDALKDWVRWLERQPTGYLRTLADTAKPPSTPKPAGANDEKAAR
jgi:hypothetical protein